MCIHSLYVVDLVYFISTAVLDQESKPCKCIVSLRKRRLTLFCKIMPKLIATTSFVQFYKAPLMRESRLP